MIQYPNPYVANPYMQQAIIPPIVQQVAQQHPVMQQQQQMSVRVSGRDEAMNRLLMMYPVNMLVPGFISDPLFDIDGHHFHTLSIESDGRRNLETFIYNPDPTFTQPNPEYVSRSEFQELVGKVNHMIGDANGIPQSVQPATATAEQSS